ncbi:MAG: MazG domain-containing protein [Oscillospiraceae bacterium]|jgi:NTP pyrophosphatase (non-canonical NTP hydrolase)
MQENTEITRDRQLDEELADVLIAISVIAKRLARKLQAINEEGGTPDGESERTGDAD